MRRSKRVKRLARMGISKPSGGLDQYYHCVSPMTSSCKFATGVCDAERVPIALIQSSAVNENDRLRIMADITAARDSRGTRTTMKHGANAHMTADPAFTTPVTATAEELRIARELRRLLRLHYRDEIDRTSVPTAWCVGAD